MMPIVRPLKSPTEIWPIVEEARVQGFPFMDRLVEEWEAGTNRFDLPGEAYFVVEVKGEVVAAGGINRDPYTDEPGVGRVRHVYVLQAARRGGAGRVLLTEIRRYACGAFRLLRLRTRTSGGAAFYEALGYARTAENGATHRLELH